MRPFVIYVPIDESEKAAARCIKSGAKFGLRVEQFMGVTPRDYPIQLAKEMGIPTENFEEKYSRFENCLSAFLSHRRLWEWSYHNNEEVLIFEHDAVVTDYIPDVPYRGVLSYGHPSYGKWVTPSTLGVNKLISKQYLPGAHAYRVKPAAAKVLIETAKTHAAPTDIYIRNELFDFVEEYYPWPVVVKETFSTIQQEAGCLAKHGYDKEYKLI
jgi:GR25 family glycosyltransferase involved in LPS biosynthesis